MKRVNDAVLSLLRFLREVLSEEGKGSWSRTGSAIVVLAYAYVVVVTQSIPERSEELAFIIGALYGVNQLKAFGQWAMAGRSQPPEVAQRSSANQLT
jgi:hypothetical protein